MFQFLVYVIAFLYIFFDVNYFLRIIFTVVVGRLFEKRVKITEPTTIYGESKLLFISFKSFLACHFEIQGTMFG